VRGAAGVHEIDRWQRLLGDEELKNAFKLVGSKGSGDALEYTVYSNELEEKVKWLKILKDLIHTRKKV
jgi:hypothetical protein